jgi:hypothetical protein
MNDPDELFFTLQAVKLINGLVSEEYSRGIVSDALMSAVAIMVNKEVSYRLIM